MERGFCLVCGTEREVAESSYGDEGFSWATLCGFGVYLFISWKSHLAVELVCYSRGLASPGWSVCQF